MAEEKTIREIKLEKDIEKLLGELENVSRGIESTIKTAERQLKEAAVKYVQIRNKEDAQSERDKLIEEYIRSDIKAYTLQQARDWFRRTVENWQRGR